MMRSLVLAIALSSPLVARAGDDPAPDYASRVEPVFKKYCVGCHNDEDREGDFSLESYASLSKGTPRGPVLKAGDPGASRIVRQLTGAAKPSMPPKGEPRPTPEEVDVLKAWIAAGAGGPAGAPPGRLDLVVPRVAARAKVRPVTALDVSRDGTWLAVARYGSVSFHRVAGAGAGAGSLGEPRRVLSDFPGKVTAVHFTPDGSRLVTASGVAGLGGVAALWEVAGGAPVRTFSGHHDLIYDAELSPDGKTLATCGYDKVVQLWDATDGKPLRTLTGHNGAVYDVTFSPDGRFIVSASADDTCKVWRVDDGLRLDTLPQPLKEEYCCAFSPDGRFIVAGGADSTIRVWEFVSRDKPRTNPMVQARFAHEGPVVRLAFTPDGSRLVTVSDDRTIKAWETTDYTELQAWGRQPDVATALAVSGDGRSLRVGRMDGSLSVYPIPEARPQGDPAESTAQAPATPATLREASGLNSAAEREPNNSPPQATALTVPSTATGVIGGHDDVDLYRFSARAGEPWVIEVDASRSGSKLDPFVEVLDARGRRVERALLQAVRSSYFTFRGKDDSTVDDFRLFNWEEMRIGEYLYADGEVSKLWLYPRGPDSGFQVYPGQGKRWGYFDTTPLAHALGEPCYVVQPHPPGAKLIPNGLPVFPLYFENDDDPRRELGKDSRLSFTAPADGDYLVKIKDVRGLGGPDFKYALTVRPSRPDFQVSLQMPRSAIGPGDVQEFKLSARRIDGFEGPIRVEIGGLPPGFSATTPLVIEAGQVEALGVITADPDVARRPPDGARATRVTASALISGRDVSHAVAPLGEVRVGEKPKLLARIGPAKGGPRSVGSSPEGLPEFEIRPGQTIALTVKVQRNGFAGPVPFGKEGSGRNLPFGVYVDALGLNGLLIPEEQDERTFFITADNAVPKQTRHFHLTTSADGGHSSPPVVLHVR
jgi:WD40 repeat protein